MTNLTTGFNLVTLIVVIVGDSCDSSFIDNSELDDDAYYFDDQDDIHIFTKYLRYFDEGNILEVEKELNDYINQIFFIIN